LYTRLGWENIGSAVHPYGFGQQAEACCFVVPAAE
jgi:hypothetical protein